MSAHGKIPNVKWDKLFIIQHYIVFIVKRALDEESGIKYLSTW